MIVLCCPVLNACCVQLAGLSGATRDHLATDQLSDLGGWQRAMS